MTGFDSVSKTEKFTSKRLLSILMYIGTVPVVTNVSPSANVHLRLHCLNFRFTTSGQLLNASRDRQFRFAPVSTRAEIFWSEIEMVMRLSLCIRILLVTLISGCTSLFEVIMSFVFVAILPDRFRPQL